MPDTLSLHVTGMTCGGCENAVRRAVTRIDGALDVSASHQDERVQVTGDGVARLRDANRRGDREDRYRVIE